MKITNKQNQEIDFLCKTFNVINPTQEEKGEYIKSTVLGEGKLSTGIMGDGKHNRLFDAKRKLDINIKMWREDLTTGLLGADELKEDFNCDYGNKLVDSIIRGVDRDYRFKTLTRLGGTILSFTNFPKIMKIIK